MEISLRGLGKRFDKQTVLADTDLDLSLFRYA